MGIASRSASTVSVLIGESAPRADFLGNLTPSHGLQGRSRSLTAEPKTAARIRKRVSTVAGRGRQRPRPHESLDVARRNGFERHLAELRVHVQSQDGLDTFARALAMQLSRPPSFAVHPDGHPARFRSDVTARHERGSHLVEPPLGVDLPAEVLRVLFAGSVAVASPIPAVRTLLDACHASSCLSVLSVVAVPGVTLWAVGLFGEPEDEVGAPVADVAADLEAAGSGAEVAPVAQGAFGDRGGSGRLPGG